MKKRRLTALLAIIAAAACAIGVASCAKKEQHTHEFSDGWSNDATDHWHAAICDDTQTEKDKSGHIWDKKVIKAATHTEQGLDLYTCTVCGYQKNETVAALEGEHAFSEVWSSDATDHWHAATCGDTQEERDKGEHVWYIRELKAATHTREGVDLYTCTVCGYAKNVTVEALVNEHEFSSEWTHDEIYHWHASTCEHSDEIYGKDLHDGKWKTITEATCTTPGSAKLTCLTCGYTTTMPLPATGHTYSQEWSVSSTNHWHAALCEHTGEKSADETHDFLNGVCTVCGYRANSELKFALSDDGSYYVVTGAGTYVQGAVFVPAEYDGKPVKAIADYAFTGSSVSEITLPYGLTEIGKSAFYGCTNLTGVYLPDTLKAIGENAFYNCSALRSITVPFGVTEIADGTFYKCTSLDSVSIIGSNMTGIGASAFGWCSSLKAVNIPYSVKSIGDSAFSECTSLEEIVLPESAATLGVGAFFNCSSLTSVTLPASLTKIEKNLFNYCSKLAQIIIPATVVEIADFAFSECRALTSVTLPESVSVLGEAAFANCKALLTVTVESDIADVGAYAFNGCDAINTVVMPTPCNVFDFISKDNITTIIITDGTNIPANLFAGCAALQNLYLPDTITAIAANAFEDCTAIQTAVIPAIAATYIPQTSLTSVVITSGEIASEAFKDCITLKTVVIADEVTSIGYGAFNGCVNIASATMPASAISYIPKDSLVTADITSGTSIGNNAFEGCVKLVKVTLPKELETIGDSAFYGCYLLSDIVIPAGVTEIGSYAFYMCSSIGSVVIPGGVTAIESSTFYGCANLSSVSLGIALETIGESAFAGCTNLGEIVIPNSVTEIGREAFMGCSSLRSATLSTRLTAISERLFAFSGLREITIPYGVQSIENEAFENCPSLTQVILPNDLSEIGARVFDGSTSLSYKYYDNAYYLGSSYNDYLLLVKRNGNSSSCEINQNTKLIAPNAFEYSNLQTITIPAGIIYIGEGAFYGCYITDATLPVFAFEHISKYNLTTLTVNGGEEIPDYAFNGCYSLTSVTLNEGVQSIGANAFEFCDNLNSLTLPDSLKSIGSYAFYYCSAINRVNIKNLVSWCEITFDGYLANPLYYANGLYVNDNSPITNFTVPYVVTKINDYAFYGYKGLTGVTVSEGVEIGGYAFAHCNNLASITVKAGAKISGYAFAHCNALTDITIGEGVTIEENAFYGCTVTSASLDTSVIGLIDVTNMSEITVASGEEIPEGAFSGCENLNRITIAGSVTTIGAGAFEGCTSLQYVSLSEGLETIGDSAFAGCSNVSRFTVPDTVTTIGAHAFEGCSKLTDYLTLSASLTTIGDYAFASTNISRVVLPENVAYVGEYAFNGCSNLGNVYVSSLHSWLNITFGNGEANPLSNGGNLCVNGNKRVDFTIPADVTKINDYAFYGYSSLGTITIQEGLTSIGEYAFAYCESFSKITLPSTLTYIGDYAFDGCYGLKEVHISSLAAWFGIEFAGVYANPLFYADNMYADRDISVTNLVIPYDVTEISDYAFYGYKGLTGVTVYGELTAIGERAFARCSNLNAVALNEGLLTIGAGAFAFCESLTSVTIPESVIDIGEQAFYGCGALEKVILLCKAQLSDGVFEACFGLTEVFFKGTSSEWESVCGENFEEIPATIYIYSEDVPETEGHFWHYDGGEVTKWEI